MSLVRLILIGLLCGLVSAVDYCKLCRNGTHTMCKYKEGPGKACIHYKKVELTSGDKKYIVDIHNDIRHHVASGHETRGTLGSQPPAADMLLLKWDEELATIAQRWADQCIQINSSIQHDVCKRTERFEVGQNILTAITTDAELPELSILILNWYKQVVNVIPTDIDYFTGIRRGKFLIGQYTQLVWAKTKYVGCGIAAFKEHNSTALYHHRLVCNYGPAGNVIGQPVYLRGTPCSKCPEGDCNILRTNLCQGLRNETNTKTDTKKLPSSKKAASTQTNISIFSNNTNIFNIKINNSLCLNPDEFNSTNIKYTKCIVGIDTHKSEVSNFTETINCTQSKTSPSSPIWDSTTDNLTAIFQVQPERMAQDPDSMIIYIPEASSRYDYSVENRTSRHRGNKYLYQPQVVETRPSSSNLTTPPISTEVRKTRNFVKARGIWHNGHCRCTRIYRSESERSNPTYFSLLPILFVYLRSNML